MALASASNFSESVVRAPSGVEELPDHVEAQASLQPVFVGSAGGSNKWEIALSDSVS